MKQGSQAKQLEETSEIAAAVEYLRTRRGMTNHDIQDALSTYGSGLVAMHQQALHTDRIAMAHQNRLHTEQRAQAEHHRIHAQASANRAAIELKHQMERMVATSTGTQA